MTGRWFTRTGLSAAFLLFVAASVLIDIPAGVRAGEHFLSFLREMAMIVPAAFVLIGLFEVWVPREQVEQHLGPGAGLASHLWSTLLAGTTVGGLVLAFPVAYALRRKGARFAVVLSYLGTAGVVRVPMTLFEISFLGFTFTLVRYAVALPLIVISAELMGRYLDRSGFEMKSP